MTRRGVLTASLAAAFFLFPLYPGFIGLTGAPVPGISLLPRALSLALFALVAAIAAYWCVLLFTTRGRPMPTLFPLAALPAAALLSALLGFDPRAGARIEPEQRGEQRGGGERGQREERRHRPPARREQQHAPVRGDRGDQREERQAQRTRQERDPRHRRAGQADEPRVERKEEERGGERGGQDSPARHVRNP